MASKPPSAFPPMMRSLCGHCPKCGQGKIFTAFLKVADQCPACAEPLHHHRADDLPAYLVVLIVGHIIVPLVCAVELAYAPPLWASLCAWLPLTLCVTLGMLQPVKGMVVALQWHVGMHGFEPAMKARKISAAVSRD